VNGAATVAVVLILRSRAKLLTEVLEILTRNGPVERVRAARQRVAEAPGRVEVIELVPPAPDPPVNETMDARLGREAREEYEREQGTAA